MGEGENGPFIPRLIRLDQRGEPGTQQYPQRLAFAASLNNQRQGARRHEIDAIFGVGHAQESGETAGFFLA